MDRVQAFRTRFTLAAYDFQDPLECVRCQNAVLEYMTLAINNKAPRDEQSVNNFCTFVADENVWHLAQMVVPQFRQTQQENEQDQSDEERDYTQLNHILEKLHNRLPHRPDHMTLTTEQDMIKQRYARYVQYIKAGGNPSGGPTDADNKEQDAVEGRLLGYSWYQDELKRQGESSRLADRIVPTETAPDEPTESTLQGSLQGTDPKKKGKAKDNKKKEGKQKSGK